MNPSISSIVTMGYGSWGSVNLLPTLGFGIREPIRTGRVCGSVRLVPKVSATNCSLSQDVSGSVSINTNVSGSVSIGQCS